MKSSRWMVPVLVTLTLGLAASAADTPQVAIREEVLTWAQAAPTDGETLYMALCATCHGIDATGNGPAAPALATAVPDLTRLAEHNGGEFPAAQVEASIAGTGMVAAHGSLEMPIWGQVFRDVRPDRKMAQREAIARERIRNLTSYLETLQKGAGSADN